MAGFQVIIYGRFWVFTEATGEGGCNTIDASLVQKLAVGELIKADLHCSARERRLQ